MSHLKQSPHTHPKRPTRSWSALLWTGLLALGSTPVYQAVHAVECFSRAVNCFFPNKDRDIERERAECLRNRDLPGYVNALNKSHSDDKSRCSSAIQDGLWVFATQPENNVPAIQALFNSKIAKQLPDHYLLTFGLTWQHACTNSKINCLKEAGLLDNRPIIQSIFDCWSNGRFHAAFDELKKWLYTQGPTIKKANALCEIVLPLTILYPAAKDFDTMQWCYDTIIKNIMRNNFDGNTPKEKALYVADFIVEYFLDTATHAVWKLIEDHDFWVYLYEDVVKKGKQKPELDDLLGHKILLRILKNFAWQYPQNTDLIQQLMHQSLTLVGQKIKEKQLIANLSNKNLNLRNIVLAQEAVLNDKNEIVRLAGRCVGTGSSKVHYSQNIAALDRATSHLSNTPLKIKVGNRSLSRLALQTIDSYLYPCDDEKIREICTLQGPRIKKFVRQQCARVLPGQAIPETFAAQLDVLVRDFQRRYSSAQRNDQQLEVQPIEQQVLALTSSEHQQEESKEPQ